MAKAKGPKLGLSFLNSFQICRPRNPSSMVKNPLPAVTYMFSPVNSKSFDISFPSFPNPPPSTPSKIIPLGCGCRSKSCTMQEMASGLDNDTYSKPRNKEIMCNSPVSSDSDETDWPIAPSRTEKKKDKRTTKKSKASDETDSLFSSRLSFNSSHDFNRPLRTISEGVLNGSKKPVKQTSVGARKARRFGSKQWKEGGEYHEKRPNSPCMEVNQSFVVVKRSVDPYEDFKKSMFEMIVEKQMFEPKELEQLLMSFLSLNSKLHHKVIIEAFTDILKEVFCG
ncbi:hypothetical protein Pfo_021637 [Paulownia fortunei]|nr:hypothetical protein Pfo_021637 [Paulownia fortunei]